MVISFIDNLSTIVINISYNVYSFSNIIILYIYIMADYYSKYLDMMHSEKINMVVQDLCFMKKMVLH